MAKKTLEATGEFTDTVTTFSDFVIENIGEGAYSLSTTGGVVIDGLESVANFIAANIKAGSITARDIATDSLVAFTATIDNLLITTGLVSPRVQTALISPLPDENTVTVQIGEEGTDEGKLAVENAEGDEVASI